jgi:hypothetical protein
MRKKILHPHSTFHSKKQTQSPPRRARSVSLLHLPHNSPPPSASLWLSARHELVRCRFAFSSIFPLQSRSSHPPRKINMNMFFVVDDNYGRSQLVYVLLLQENGPRRALEKRVRKIQCRCLRVRLFVQDIALLS